MPMRADYAPRIRKLALRVVADEENSDCFFVKLDARVASLARRLVGHEFPKWPKKRQRIQNLGCPCCVF